MREPVRDRDRLEHIVEAIDRILDNTDFKSRDELEADNLRYYGIVKSIEIIGEAAYKLTHAFCREHAATLGSSSPRCAMCWYMTIIR